ncbi:hypothetical protein PSFL_07600 [Pseudomonas sp. DD1]
MSSGSGDARIAAQHLMSKLQARPGEISISTFTAHDSQLLRVFLRPGSKYHKHDIPSLWEGFTVLCEYAETPVAGRG